jgi:hypothetical protein
MSFVHMQLRIGHISTPALRKGLIRDWSIFVKTRIVDVFLFVARGNKAEETQLVRRGKFLVLVRS